MQIAVEEGRKTKPGLKLGVCGEHGGDPESIHFFHTVGLDYVSCSPFRVPVARLEAGRAAVSSPDSRATAQTHDVVAKDRAESAETFATATRADVDTDGWPRPAGSGDNGHRDARPDGRRRAVDRRRRWILRDSVRPGAPAAGSTGLRGSG